MSSLIRVETRLSNEVVEAIAKSLQTGAYEVTNHKKEYEAYVSALSFSRYTEEVTLRLPHGIKLEITREGRD